MRHLESEIAVIRGVSDIFTALRKRGRLPQDPQIPNATAKLFALWPFTKPRVRTSLFGKLGVLRNIGVKHDLGLRGGMFSRGLLRLFGCG